MNSYRRPSIAVDASPSTRPVVTGTEAFTREVVVRLTQVAPELDWSFYSPLPAPFSTPMTVLPPQRAWTQSRLPLAMWRRRPDLFVDLAHVVPEWCPAPAFKVFHDLAYELFPSAYPTAARLYMSFTGRSAARRAVGFAAVSEATRQDLARLYGLDPQLVTVAYNGGGELPPSEPEAGDSTRLAELGITGDFVLHVGRIEPRKNQATALAAVSGLENITLVCAGAVHDRALGAQLQASPRCLVLGRITNADRDLLYRSARALLFPSLYEGFGVPVIEALRHGLPVVTARNSSLPEVGGDVALYAAAATDHEGLRTLLLQALHDQGLRRRVRAAGPLQAARFTWDACAESIAAGIRSALQRRPMHARSVRRSSPS